MLKRFRFMTYCTIEPGIVDLINQDTTFHKVIDKKHSKEDILKVITTYKSNFEPGTNTNTAILTFIF